MFEYHDLSGLYYCLGHCHTIGMCIVGSFILSVFSEGVFIPTRSVRDLFWRPIGYGYIYVNTQMS